MSTDVVVRVPTPVALSIEQLQYIANTEFVPPGLRGNMPAILACVATGRELGIGDMVSLKSIHIIDGKATFSAELMVMLVRRQGHSIIGQVKDGVATVTGTRGDNGDTITVVWTRDMADRAGLLGKSNWKKYEDSMLWARAASQLCRMLFPDCFAGATYTTEELGDENTAANGAPEGDSAAGTPFGYDHDEPLDPPLEQVLSGSAGDPTAVEATDGPPVPQAGQETDPEHEPASPADTMPAAASPSSPVAAGSPIQPPREPRYISDKQRERLFTIATKAGVPEAVVREIVIGETGQASTKEIPAGQVYDTIITAIQAKATA